jgi:hypothetical protein
MSSEDFGKEVGKFPPMFAKAVVFGEHPSRERASKLNNGTVSLLRLDCGPVAVTCYHVTDFYRERVNGGEKCLFQVGQCRLDPLDQLLSESSNADLAVLKLTEAQADEMVADGSHIGSRFFVPPSWPPVRAAEGDDVAFCGFPGEWREAVNYDSLQFASYSIGDRVTGVGKLAFFCAFDRQSWLKRFDYKGADSLPEFRGMSGGPAFALRSLNFEFVGVIKEYAADTDAIYFAHAGLIGSDGHINL